MDSFYWRHQNNLKWLRAVRCNWLGPSVGSSHKPNRMHPLTHLFKTKKKRKKKRGKLLQAECGSVCTYVFRLIYLKKIDWINYNNFKWPVTWSISCDGAGPMASTVFELGAICVRPASRIKHVLRFLSRAALNTDIISSSLSTFTAILALPLSSHRRTSCGNRFTQFWYAPTAAWPHCAPILPLPIFKSFRTTRIIFKSLPSRNSYFHFFFQEQKQMEISIL